MKSTILKALLDSTYLLPTFGIEIEGLTDEEIAKLREAKIKGKVKLYCSPLSWIEIIGKVCREMEHAKIELDEIIDNAVKSLLKSKFYEWILPNPEAVKLAFKLRRLGHKDNIDNLLYATSIKEGIILLTMDEALKRFLSKNNLKTENLLDHKDLLKELERHR